MTTSLFPCEIWANIFSIYVQESSEATTINPVTTLQLVHPEWNETAVSTYTLWTRISWSSNTPLPPPMVNCRTLGALARTINRTAEAKLDVTLEIPNMSPTLAEFREFSSNVNFTWLSRCEFLKLRTSFDVHERSLDTSITQLLLRPGTGFESLDTLILSHLDFNRCESSLPNLLNHIKLSAGSLRRLELDYDDDVSLELTQELENCDILRRVQELKIPTSIGNLSWEDLPNLLHLDVVSVDSLFGPPTSLSTLTAPSLAYLRLEGFFRLTQLPPATIVRQLTHLEAIGVPQDVDHALSDMRANVGKMSV